MALTTVSVRLAIKRIAELTCGTRPKVVPVRITSGPAGRALHGYNFAVAVPFEYRLEIYAFLEDRLKLQTPGDGRALILTREEASAVVELALSSGTASA